MKKKKLSVPAFLLILCAVLFMAGSVSAAPKYQNKWVRTNGKVYFYNSKGKKATGLTKIKTRTYYFDSKGVQRTGWKKIRGNYYFFRIANGSGGYMITSKTVNGIKLSKTGTASYNSAGLRKLNVMIKANSIVESITNCDMTRAEKLRKCYYTIMNYTARDIGDFQYSSDWDVYYAEWMLNRGFGDCYCYGAAFAYLANAVGMSYVNVVSSGGHGWAEVSNKVFDPNVARYGAGGKDAYYAMPYSLSNVGGRPNYKPNRLYVKKV